MPKEEGGREVGEGGTEQTSISLWPGTISAVGSGQSPCHDGSETFPGYFWLLLNLTA